MNDSEPILHDLLDIKFPPPREIQLKPFVQSWRMWTGNILLLSVVGFILLVFIYKEIVPVAASFYGQPAVATVTEKYITCKRGLATIQHFGPTPLFFCLK